MKIMTDIRSLTYMDFLCCMDMRTFITERCIVVSSFLNELYILRRYPRCHECLYSSRGRSEKSHSSAGSGACSERSIASENNSRCCSRCNDRSKRGSSGRVARDRHGVTASLADAICNGPCIGLRCKDQRCGKTCKSSRETHNCQWCSGKSVGVGSFQSRYSAPYIRVPSCLVSSNDPEDNNNSCKRPEK